MIWDILKIAFGPINPFYSFFNFQNGRLECRMSKFPVALVFMFLYSCWCVAVVLTGMHETTPDVEKTFNVVGATLAFILPLIAANAVARNKEALNNYNAFCGDVLALGWEVLAYVRDENNNKIEDVDKKKIQDLFEVCLILPTMVKWKFREGLDITKVYMRKYAEKPSKDNIENFNVNNIELVKTTGSSDKFEKRFIKTSIGGWYYYLLKKVSNTDINNELIIKKGIDECDLLFAMLNKIISDFKLKDEGLQSFF